MAVILSAGVYAANIANAVNEKPGEYGWEVSLFETVNVPISEWGLTLAKIRQDPPPVICVTHFSGRRPGPVHGAVPTQPHEQLGLHAVRPVDPGLQDEIGTAFETRFKANFGENAGHNSGAQSYDGAWVWAKAAALAGGSGEPGNEEQNRQVADRMTR